MATRAQIYPKLDTEVATGLLFAMAIITASVRTAIRIKYHRRLFVDDAFLIFACLALTTLIASVLYYTPTIYLAAAISDGQLYKGSSAPPTSVPPGALILKYRKAQLLRGSLAWLTIFAVKFSFLSFFRTLTDRLPRLFLYWKVVVTVTVFAFVYCVACGFIGCPDSDDYKLQCLSGSGSEKLSILIGFAIAFDILSDMLIISVPTFIIWKVKMKLRQKLGISSFLCLSTLMIIFACVRFSGTHTHANIVQSWEYFWLEIEACVAVCMVSLCGFRSFFVAEERRARLMKARPWYSSTVARLRNRKKMSEGVHKMGDLPTIPSATLSGLRTYIRSYEYDPEADNYNTSSDGRSLRRGRGPTSDSV